MDYFSILSGKVGDNEAEAKIKERIEEFHGLLTKEAAAKLIASEMGLIEREVAKISELKEGMGAVDLEGEIVEIGQLRSFPSGAVLRVLAVSDGTGEAHVNFWGEEAKKAGGMHLGDILEIKKAYVKMGKVNIGYKSTYSVSKEAKAVPIPELKEGARLLVVGKVDSILGRKGDVFIFSITNGKKSVPVSLLRSPEKGEHLQVGDSVLLEGVEYNGAEIMVEGRARMLLKKNRENIFRGKLDGISMEGENAVLEAGGEKFSMEKGTLVKFLNLKGLKEDIDLQMIVKMKEPEIRGKGVFIVFKETKAGKEAEQAEIR